MKQPLLQLKEITKQYFIRGRIKSVLDRISFDLYPGEIVVLLGINGAGKSTLFSILGTLIPPSSGQMLWENMSVYKQLSVYRKILGYCPQKPNLDPTLTLEKNLVFAGRYYGLEKTLIEQRKEMLIEQFHLEDVVKRPIKELSGGYKQRFLLARTLMHNPQLIILDEPMVGLDSSIRRLMLSSMNALRAEGRTIVLATHYLEEIELLADRVMVLDKGDILAIDSPDQLKKRWKKESLEDVFLHLFKQ